MPHELLTDEIVEKVADAICQALAPDPPAGDWKWKPSEPMFVAARAALEAIIPDIEAWNRRAPLSDETDNGNETFKGDITCPR